MLAITPGPGIFYVAARTLAGGRAEGVASSLGTGLGGMVHVLAGSGQLTTELGTVELAPGALVWLPRRSKRAFKAGPGGLRYLTVHQRRQALVLEPAPARAARSE